MTASCRRHGAPAAAVRPWIAADSGRIHAARQRGFTLVELLVSVLVFAVLAAGAYMALDGLSASAAQHRQHSDRLAEIQRAISRLDADLRQLVSRPARAADGILHPALRGQPGELSATRAGWINPANQPRSQLQRFGWTRAGENLERTAWPVTDRVPATPAHGEILMTGVRGFGLRYRDQAGQWYESWPPAGQSADSLPRAVEYRIELRDRGSIRRLVALEP